MSCKFLGFFCLKKKIYGHGWIQKYFSYIAPLSITNCQMMLLAIKHGYGIWINVFRTENILEMGTARGRYRNLPEISFTCWRHRQLTGTRSFEFRDVSETYQAKNQWFHCLLCILIITFQEKYKQNVLKKNYMK